MKRIVLCILCFLIFLGILQAGDLDETDKKVFFYSIPDRKTAGDTLEPLLKEEWGELSVLSDKLSDVLTKLFSIHRGNVQEECEYLAQALNSATGYEQQLGALDAAICRW